jgi:hypothetical protein
MPKKPPQTITLMSFPVLYIVTSPGFCFFALGPDTHSINLSLAQLNTRHSTCSFPTVQQSNQPDIYTRVASLLHDYL